MKSCVLIAALMLTLVVSGYAQNFPPVACAEVLPGCTIYPGTGVLLHGYADDPDGDGIAECIWEVLSEPAADLPSSGSGLAPAKWILSNPSDPVTGFVSRVPGTYTLSFRLTDGRHWSGPAYLDVVVQEWPGPIALPVAEFGMSPNPAREHVTVYVDASASYHPAPPHSIVKYEWDFSLWPSSNSCQDLQLDALGKLITHIYPEYDGCTERVYIVGLRITDDVGQSSYMFSNLHNTFTPRYSVSPPNLDFDQVAVSGHRDQTFILESIGETTLSGLVSTSPPFSIVSGEVPYSLDPGDSLIVVVRFSPTEIGPVTGSVDLGTCCSTPRGVTCKGVGRAASVLYVRNSASGLATGYSWTDAFTEVWQALEQSVEGPVDVWVAEGTYKPKGSAITATFGLRSQWGLYGGFAGVEREFEERDVADHPTTLSGDIGGGSMDDNCLHVVTAMSVDSTAVLDGFTVTMGNAQYGAGLHDRGGGMYAVASSPRVANTTFFHNYASYNGYGGGMYCAQGGCPSLTRVTFESNVSAMGAGMTVDQSSARLNHVTFRDNQATCSGGGLQVEDGQVWMDGVLFAYNVVYEGSGGGMFCVNSPVVQVVNSVFWGNVSIYGAGAAYLDGSDAVIVNTSCGSNSMGIYNWSSSPQLTNVVMWGDDWVEIANLTGETSRPSISHSIISGSGGSADWDSSLGIDMGGNLDSDPLYVDYDLRVAPESPAIDAGDNGAPCLPASDMDGAPRVVNGSVDIGAYEYQPPAGIGDDPLEPTIPQLWVYPNPASHGVLIAYYVPLSGSVEILVYDIRGRQVARLLSTSEDAGRHTLSWDSRGQNDLPLASGIYFVRLRTGTASRTTKFLVLK